MSEPKVLLVDLGSVVIKSHWEIAGRNLLDYYRGSRGQMTGTEFIQPLRNARHYINEFDRGHITPFEFYCWATDLLGLERRDISYPTFRNIYGSNRVSLNEPMIKLLKNLEVRKVIASNINEISWSGLCYSYGTVLRELFEDQVLSYTIQSVKPEFEFWQECGNRVNQRLDMLHLIDDLFVNCDSFRKLGGKYVLYDINDHARAETKIKTMLSSY